MTDDDLLATANPLLQRLGASFYFVPATLARGAELGLDPVQLYVLGRGGVLGNAEPAVVSAAFGYFNPDVITGAWRAGSEKVTPRDAARVFMECCAAFGRDKFAGLAGLDAFVAAAEQVVDAADADGLALFAGIAAEPRADDAPARALQLIVALRELRGSAHLVALRATGLDTKTAHFVKRPNDIRLFGWTDDDAPAIDDAVLAKMDAAEKLTDQLVRPAFAVLDDAGRRALIDGLQAMAAALSPS